MRNRYILGIAASAALVAGSATAGTLDDVKARGKLLCGVSPANIFSAPDAQGVWQGFDVAFCRAAAAGVLGDPQAVDFIPTTGETRFTALAAREVDLLARSTSWTYTRDVDIGTTPVGVSYYDGQTFIVPKELGVKSVQELDGSTICIITGTTTELNLSEYFRENGLTYEPVPVESTAEGQRQYLSHACDVFTGPAFNLAAMRSGFSDPAAHVIFQEHISKEPVAPLARQGDDQWADYLRWTLNALIAAEEFGITQENVEQVAAETGNPEVKRLLGAEGNLGEGFGLDAEWAKRAIQAGGNYGEIFDNNLGAHTTIRLERGKNALYRNGGLMYALPFR